MACNWITNSQGDIVGAKINGTEERSKLFDDLNEEFGMDKALELFSVSESTSFKDIFGENLNKTNKKLNDEQSNTEYRNRRRWNESRGSQTLEGAPIIKTRKNVTGADPELTYWAEEYARRNNISYQRQTEYVEVDEGRAKRIAEAYDKMKHTPSDPRVKEAFENLINQTIAQYRILEEAGYKFYFFDETNDPYNGSPYGAMEELRNKKRMGSFATEAGFGSGATELNVEDNPMLVDTGMKWGYGSTKGAKKRVLANDVFRAVHDAFGHGLEGAGFRARGEENAWQSHARLFTGSAIGAITSETRGQNSWLNYGKFGEQNKTAKVEDTVFADQKTGLMPEWTWKEGFDAPKSENKEPSKQSVIKYVVEENKTEEKLTKEQLVDLQDFSNFDTQKLQDAFYDKSGLFIVSESKLVKSGLYNEYEASSIARDTQLQNKIKDSIERLKNTPQEELNIEEIEESRSVIGEFNSFGKLVALNPFLAEKEMTEDQKQADSFIEVDGQIRQKNITETEITLQQTAKQTENNKVLGLLTLSLETLQNNEGATREVLNEIEDDLIEDSIDVIGLKDQPIDESLIDYLNTLNTFIEEPSTENTKLFAEKSDEYFKRDLTPKKETVVGEDGKEYVKLNTELSEEEVYNQQGLIKVDDNTYLKTAKEDLATLYENVRTYKEKYPKDKTLEEYVQEQIANYSFKDAEVAEAVVLYKMYFGVGDRDREGNLLAPNGKKSNLNEEQYKLVRTPEFKAWFGDWQNNPQNASKVVDENGEPLVVYHGSPNSINIFDKTKTKEDAFHFGSMATAKERLLYNYKNKESNIIPSFLNIKNMARTGDVFEGKPLTKDKVKHYIETFENGDNIYDENKILERFENIRDGRAPRLYEFYKNLTEKTDKDFEAYLDETIRKLGESKVATYDKNISIDGIVYKNTEEGIGDDSYVVFNPNQIKSATEIKGTTNEETNDIRFLKKIKPTNQTSNFTGDYQYLTEEFPSDFYSKFLAEKKLNSKLFRNFYSNFEINEKGINIINTDPISMRNIRIHADENLRQYSILSKQMPNISDDLSNDESISERDNVANNPQSLEKFQGKIHKLNNNEVIVKNNTEQFIKIGDNIYEAIEVLGNLTHFAKVENEVTQYHKVGIGQPTSSLKLADYNYLNDSVNAEDFKDVRKGENPEELNC